MDKQLDSAEMAYKLRLAKDYPHDINLFDKAADMIESLQAQLKESRARERAAVMDIEMVMRSCTCGCACRVCSGGNCPDSPFATNCEPKYRGPGEGETDNA